VPSHPFGGGCGQHSLHHYGTEETGNRISPVRALNILAKRSIFVAHLKAGTEDSRGATA
jgi:hypothetical protein